MSDPVPCERCGHTHERCAGHIKNGPRKGQPCRQWAVTGTTVCKVHGGNAPQVKAAGKRRAQQQAAAEAVATYGLPVDISPTEALLEEVHWTAGHVQWLRARVQEVEQKNLTVGVAEQTVDPKGGKTVKIKSVPNVWSNYTTGNVNTSSPYVAQHYAQDRGAADPARRTPRPTRRRRDPSHP